MKASKDKLEKLLEAQLKKHDVETTGGLQSLKDRLQALGLVGGQQVIKEGFSVTTPYAVTNRFVRGQAS
ncbi:hypothetical protein AAVH_29790 [Aphelenchoides avenae]|nr:hypothetical protein AAVH_29790 [Aphelenchus avenae]